MNKSSIIHLLHKNTEADFSVFSTYIRENINTEIVEMFRKLYGAWMTRCQMPDILIQSNPLYYTDNEEFHLLQNYCIQLGDKVLPLVYDKVCNGEFLGDYIPVDPVML